MKKWTKLVATAAVVTALVGGTGATYAATQSSQPQTTSQAKAKQKSDHVKLTKEQKQALKDAGIDKKAAREQAKQLKQASKALKADLKQVKAKVKGNKDLKKQVKQDATATKDLTSQLRDLHKQDKDLRTQFKAALQAADSAKIKDLFNKLNANRTQELTLIQQLDTAAKAELQKVQG
ncbi:MAG: hypothetical protein ACXVP5_07440 [Tumebacillaceae bacterium]